MTSFIRKKVATDKNIGEILKTVREEKHYGLYYISQTLKIPEKYLKSLEENQYDMLPDQVYAKNFLRSYCKFLGLNFNQIYDQFKKELTVFQKTGKGKKGEQMPPKKTSGWSFFITPRLIKGLLIVLVLVISLTYLGIKINAIFSLPFLIVNQPSQDLVVLVNQLEIIGQTEASAILKINERQVLPNAAGVFKEVVNLNQGINIIKITAKKRYSREAVVERVIQVVE